MGSVRVGAQMFQSLIGFKINWNTTFRGFLGIAYPFQSLIGFKINWNAGPANTLAIGTVFQSLIGFKINWNPQKIFVEPISLGSVSIPNRV